MQSAVANVAHDADHGPPDAPWLTWIEGAHQDAPADRILAGPQGPCRGLADDSDALCTGPIGVGEEPATNQRNSHRLEIAWRGDLIVHRWVPSGALVGFALAFEPDTRAEADRTKRERSKQDGTGGFNARESLDPSDQLDEPRIARPLDRTRLDRQRQDVGRLESKVDPSQIR